MNWSSTLAVISGIDNNLCLGKLHYAFANLRVIGMFIDCFSLDDAWISAKWFDSESLLQQVKD